MAQGGGRSCRRVGANDGCSFVTCGASLLQVDTMKGLSVRSIFTSIITQSIIFLYLCDNDASWIILISSGVGLLIEIWKVKKAMNVSFDASKFPYVILDYKDSYSSETLKYDQMAMKYLSVRRNAAAMCLVCLRGGSEA